MILTRNEEKNIKRCLESVRFADEIILIDDNSTDQTVEIAKKFGAVIYLRALNFDFASQRIYGLEKAVGDWVFFVDADEVVTPELAKEINLVVEKGSAKEAYYIKRRDFWWGRELRQGEVRKVRNQGLIRLIKNKSGSWEGKVHEIFRSRGTIGRLNSYLNHYPHPTLKEFIEEVNSYSSIRAKELLLQGKETNTMEIVLYPFFKFMLNYFLCFGFLDGPPGFVYSFMMSFHSFLVRAKLYQYTKLDSRNTDDR